MTAVVKELLIRQDIAVFGAPKIYKLVTDFLRESRQKANCAFAEDLTYLMVSWAQLNCHEIDQKSVRVRWPASSTSSAQRSEFTFKDVPDMKRNVSRSLDVDVDNVSQFNQVLRDRVDLMISVSHDVFVLPSGPGERRSTERKSRRRQGGDKNI